MADYRIAIKPSALKELEGVRRKMDRKRIVSRIRSLANDPRPRGCEKLSGRAERFRIRQGDYRIIYGINDDYLTVTVVRIGHRKDVYR